MYMQLAVLGVTALMALTYTRSQLIGLRTGQAWIRPCHFRPVKSIQWKPTHRGVKAGSRVVKRIKPWITDPWIGSHGHSACVNPPLSRGVDLNNLRPIQISCEPVTIKPWITEPIGSRRHSANPLVSRGVNFYNLRPVKPSCDLVTDRQKLRIGCLNARSVKNKTLSLADYILSEDFDIFAITETWLGSSVDQQCISELVPNGYDIKSIPRQDKRDGGGVAVVYKQTLTIRVVESTVSRIFTHFEYLDCEIRLSSRTILLSVIYRPPPSQRNGLKNTVFFEEWSNYIEKHSVKSVESVIVGDLNFHLDKPDDFDAQRFLQCMEDHSLKQHVTEPTHIRGHILDVLITKDTSKMVSNVNVMDSGVRNSDGHRSVDHFTVSFDTNLSKPGSQRKCVSFRKFKEVNIPSLQSDIRKSPLLNLQEGTADELAEAYDKGVKKLVDKHAPVRQKTITLRPNAPWYTEELHEAKRARRRLERQWRKTHLEVHRQMYQLQCKVVNRLLHETRRDYFQTKIMDYGNDQRGINRVVKHLLGSSSSPVLPQHTSAQELADQFNAFFTDKIVKIRSGMVSADKSDNRVPECPTASPAGEVTNCLTGFALATEEEIHKIIRDSAGKSCALDPWPTWLLKDCLDETLPMITRIVNQSLVDGEVPRSFKRAHIKPLLKKAGLDQEVFKNYRPVSNLSFISKILEKVVSHRLDEHLNLNGLCNPFQSAYTPFHSTETALLKVQSDILDALAAGNVCVLVLLDLSAAFDTIDHTILLDRLRDTYSISGTALKWFASYLGERYQSVIVNDKSSDPSRLCFGVPQGSVLGPKLYTLYTKPLGDLISSHGVQYHMYADDTQLYIFFKKDDTVTQDSAIQRLEACLADIEVWMQDNMLKLNCDKTEVAFFSSKRSIQSAEIQVNVGGAAVVPQASVRNLGAVFDQFLAMDKHISSISRSCFLHLRNIGRIRRYLPEKATKTLVHSLVTSRMDYCNSLLVGINASQVRRLQLVQNAAARLVTRTKKSDHITPVLKELHWLPIRSRIEYKLLLHVYRALHGRAPSYLSEMIKLYQPPRQLRSGSQNKLCVPRTRCKIAERSFRVSGPVAWNALPQELCAKVSLASFKCRLKTHCFKLAFDV